MAGRSGCRSWARVGIPQCTDGHSVADADPRFMPR